MKRNLTIALIAAFAVTLSGAAFAANKKTSDDMERVEVTGQYSTTWYREQAEEKEDDFYALFNQLSDKEEFNVDCGLKKRDNNSRIKVRTCEANFISDIMNKSYPGLGRKARELARDQEYRQKAKEQLEYMVQLINNHEALKTQYVVWQNAKQKFIAAKEAE